MNYQDVLGVGGLVAKRLRRYEERPEQLAMAQGVTDAISERHHLLVEAGTGVGKSFAYLVPSILYAVSDQISPNNLKNRDPFSPSKDGESDSFSDDPFAINPRSESLPDSFEVPLINDESFTGATRPRVVISTHTISLQEQLFEKDIPFLGSILPYEFTSVLVKGRNNYLCLRRLSGAMKKSASLFEDEEDQELSRLFEWSRHTPDGSLSDLNPQPLPDVWSEVACEQGNCLGRHCAYYNDCFYQMARRRIERASLIVVNHALLFSDLAIKALGGSLLPNYDILIFDEAHTMEQVAADHLGISLSEGQIDYTLNRLFNDRTMKGLLTVERSDSFKNRGIW